MTALEFNQRRQHGWNPVSPESIPLIPFGTPITATSTDIVIGYHWSAHRIDDVREEGSTLDGPGDVNAYGASGSCRTEEYGVGVLYTHRDISEALGLWDWMEDGYLYEITGYAVDRQNPGLTSAGALDEIERIFPVSQITGIRELSREAAERLPTLYDRIGAKA